MSTQKPWQKWYWQDWLGDPRVRALTAEERCYWFELIGWIWLDLSGVTSALQARYISVTPPTLSNFWGVKLDECEAVLRKLHDVGVANIEWQEDGTVQIASRRIAKDLEQRFRVRDRVKKHRTSDPVTSALQERYSPVRARTRDHTPPTEHRIAASPNGEPAAKLPVAAVVEAYRKHHPRARPGDKEKRLIRARLAEGNSESDLIEAIDGNHRDPWCCGDNDRGKRYHALSLILRDADHVTKFREVYHGEAKPVDPEEAAAKARLARPGKSGD